MEKLFKLLGVACLLLTMSFSYAQQGTVTGIVTDEGGMSIPGATVKVKGADVGTISDISGKYQLQVEKGAILQFSYVSMSTQEIEYTGQAEINVVLLQGNVDLDEVVVTALGIKRDKKALGYSVQDVKEDEIKATNDPQLISALQGKIAGVQISESGAGAGGSFRVEIRGASSLSDNNSPLYVIDGIPFDDSKNGGAGIWGGVERAGAAFDINPNDVESVSVLKGPNAAALYGSRAGNGVIIITTKKGTRGQGLGIDYTGALTMSEAAYFLNTQDQFGQGSAGVYDRNSTVSWGPKFNGQQLESWTGEMIPYEAQTDRIKDFVKTGVSQNHSVAFTGGNESGSFRASIGKDVVNGLYDGHKIDKLTFDFRGDYDINKWLNIDTKFSYFQTEGNNRPNMGYYSIMSYYNGMPMNIRNEDLAPGYDIVNGRHVEKLYTTANANYRNPYFLLAQETNRDERYRTFGYFAGNIKFTDDLKLRLKYGLDFYREETESAYLYADNVSSQRPEYFTNEGFFKEENAEFLLSYNKAVKDFNISLNAGGNRMVRSSQSLNARSGLLPDEGYYFLGYGTNVQADEIFSDEEVQSLYGFGQVGYKSMLFLDLTARNDWSSTLPMDNNSYFYPSVSISAIPSEMMTMPKWLDYTKVRASWAQVGKATTPYSISQVYTVTQYNFNLLSGNPPQILVNENLMPEISSSFEVGFDVRMFMNRIGLDFTYYNEQTKNQILAIATNQSTGYYQKLINAGLISNKGIEVMLKTNPIKTKDFSFNLDFNFAKNTTLVKELDENLKEYVFGGINNGVQLVGTEGELMGDIIGKTYRRDDSGNLIVGADGLPLSSEERSVIGNIQADWTGSVTLGANYKGFGLNAMVYVQQGGDIFSVTEQSAVAAGNSERTIENDRIPIFVEGVTEAGDINTTMVSAQEYWGTVAGIDEEFIYDASHMKLRELSLSYTFSESQLSKLSFVQSVRIALVGRNLLYFYKHTPGTVPDASAYASTYAAQAFDFTPLPATRTYGFSINVSF